MSTLERNRVLGKAQRPWPNLRRQWLLVSLTLAATSALAASTVLPQLYGKSVALSWTTTRTVKESGEVKSIVATATMKVYVSTQGHIFMEKGAVSQRSGRRHPHEHGGRQEVADSGDNSEVREWRAEGRSLVGYKLFARGARRIVVDFDPSFTTCSVKIGFAKQAGTPSILQRGGMREIESIQVQSTSCSIQAGNVFAQ